MDPRVTRPRMTAKVIYKIFYIKLKTLYGVFGFLLTLWAEGVFYLTKKQGNDNFWLVHSLCKQLGGGAKWDSAVDYQIPMILRVQRRVAGALNQERLWMTPLFCSTDWPVAVLSVGVSPRKDT